MSVVLKNIRHHRFRYLYIGVLMMLMTVFVISSIVLVSSVKEGIRTAKNKLGADLVVLSGESAGNVSPEDILYDGVPQTLRLDSKYCDEIRAIPGISAVVPRLYLATLSGASCCDGQIQLIATDMEDDFLLSSWVDTKDIRDDEIILGYQFRNSAGETVRYLGREFRVADVLDKTNTGYDISGFITLNAAKEIIADPEYQEYFGEFRQDDVSMIFVSADDPKTANNIIKSQFGNELTVYASDKKLSEYTGTVNMLQGFVWIVNVLLVIINTISLFAITGIATQSRKNEIGSMMTIGYSKKQISWIFVREQLCVVLAATLAAAVVCFAGKSVAKQMLEYTLGLPMSNVPAAKQAVIIAALTVINGIIACVSAIVSVRSVCSAPPAELIKEGS